MFHERLKKLRNARDLTQQELADRLKISRGTYAHYELGKREPDVETINKLAIFFNVSTDYLLRGQEHTSSAVSPEEAEFIKWVDTNVGGAFFYDFDKSPEEHKERLMKDLRYMWERDKKQDAEGKKKSPKPEIGEW